MNHLELSEINKKFLKNETFKLLVDVQKMAEKPNIIGIIQLHNCADTHGLHCINERKYLYGNMKYAYEQFNYYKSLFHEYLLLLNDDDTIYPSKDALLETLFIHGEYDFLNFTRNDERQTRRFKDDNGQITTMTYFNYKENDDHDDTFIPTKTYTRIKKGDTIKFYNEKLKNKKQWNDDSCYLTLSTNRITDKDFFDTFSSKKYKEVGQKEIMEFTIHDLILKMIVPKEAL